MKIYTKTGDAGDTGLLAGGRVPKDDPRIEACGTVDELNSALGVVRATELLPSEIGVLLGHVQAELFCLGAELATPSPGAHGMTLIGGAEIGALELAIDRHEAPLEPLRHFILPAGNPAAAHLHLARAICRRAERRVVALRRDGDVRSEVLVYLNRLSDLLFVLARTANHVAGRADVIWTRPE